MWPGWASLSVMLAAVSCFVHHRTARFEPSIQWQAEWYSGHTYVVKEQIARAALWRFEAAECGRGLTEEFTVVPSGLDQLLPETPALGSSALRRPNLMLGYFQASLRDLFLFARICGPSTDVPDYPSKQAVVGPTEDS